MRQSRILHAWRDATGVEAFVRAIAPQEVQAARNFFQQLKALPSEDEARSSLANADAQQSRRLAWLLLDDVMQLDSSTEVDRARSLLDWSALVADFSGSLDHPEDNLKEHCEFYRGVLLQSERNLGDAEDAFALAETGYRENSASFTLRACALYMLGLVALERGNVDDDTFYGGARKRFASAVTLFAGGGVNGAQAVAGEARELADRALNQWQLARDLVQSRDHDALLVEQAQLVDLNLIDLLQDQTWMMVVRRQPVSDVLLAARLVESVSARFKQPVHFVDDVTGSYLSAGRFDEAEWVVREQLKQLPANAPLKRRLAGILEREGKYAEERGIVEELLKESPDDVKLHGLLAMACFALNDLPCAEEQSRRALELDPDDPTAAFVRQQLAQLAPKPGIAVHGKNIYISEELLQQPSPDLSAMLGAAMIAANPDLKDEFLAGVDPELAQRIIPLLQEQGLMEAPPLPPAQQHYERAEQFFAQHRMQDAIAEYRLVIEADPNFADAYAGWGDVYFTLHQYHLAIAYFEEALAIQPSPSTYRFVGDAYRAIGKRDKAIAAYQEALKMKPDYVGAKGALQQLLQKEA